MAKNVTTKNGKEITLRTIPEKTKMFKEQLNSGMNYKGEPLDDAGIAYRRGYVQARREEGKLWHWKQKKNKKPVESSQYEAMQAALVASDLEAVKARSELKAARKK